MLLKNLSAVQWHSYFAANAGGKMRDVGLSSIVGPKCLQLNRSSEHD